MNQPKHEFHWLESHIGTIDDAEKLAKEFTWKISVVKHEDEWVVFDGDAKVLCSTNREVVDAFLYGLALAYICIPDPYHSQLKKDLNDWLDEHVMGNPKKT